MRIDPDEAIERLRRILRLAARVGALEGVRPDAPVPGQPTPDEIAALLREATAATMVLVRNERDILPLDRSRLRRVAIIGPNAAEARIQGGGSATVFRPTACPRSRGCAPRSVTTSTSPMPSAPTCNTA